MINNYNPVTNGGGTLPPVLETALIKKTASGNPASFTDGADGLLLALCNVNVTTMQEGTGRPLPDNVRNFIGLDSLTVKRFGVDETDNLLEAEIAIGQTVYNGKLDVLSGTFTTRWMKKTFTGASSEDWEMSSSQRFYAPFGRGIYYNRTSASYILSNKLTSVHEGGMGTTNYACAIASNNRVDFRITSSINSVALLRNWLNENPVDVLAYLTTPITIDVDKVGIKTLYGTNNITADYGTVDAKYYVDATLAYEQLQNAIVSLGGNV